MRNSNEIKTLSIYILLGIVSKRTSDGIQHDFSGTERRYTDADQVLVL